jgi:hypothetical protein
VLKNTWPPSARANLESPVSNDLEHDAKRVLKERVSRVQAILRRWDPIGVRPGEYAPADEYDSYAPQLVSLVAQGCSMQELCAQLETIRVHSIGVGANSAGDALIAEAILEALRGEPGPSSACSKR